MISYHYHGLEYTHCRYKRIYIYKVEHLFILMNNDKSSLESPTIPIFHDSNQLNLV